MRIIFATHSNWNGRQIYEKGRKIPKCNNKVRSGQPVRAPSPREARNRSYHKLVLRAGDGQTGEAINPIHAIAGKWTASFAEETL